MPWSRHDLTIPYAWNGNARDAREVVLYYSADQGRSWQRAGAALPHVRSFRFQAPSDGEYWFAIRTYNALGTATPPGPLGPEMRVQVDTSLPRIDRLDAAAADGMVAVELAASDASGIDPKDVHLYAQAAGQPGWTPVPVSSSQPSPDGRSMRLSGTYRSGGAAGVSIRATVVDKAGNRTEQSAIARAAVVPPTLPSANASIARTQPSAYGTHDPFAAAEAKAVPQQNRPAAAPRRERRQPLAATPWPSESTRSKPLLAGTRSSDRWPESSQAKPFSSASFRSGPVDPFPSTRDPFGPGSPSAGLNAATPSRLVNSTEFEFDYELEDTGRWGVAKVELWGTDNGGKSWRRFAIDSDRQSPIHVTTPGEGEYGFRLVIESIGGLDPTSPRPGDTPEAIVGVDLESPRVVLTDLRQGSGYFADQLMIQWRADDAHLSERPIDLFYSNRSTGPWIPVATNLGNTGQHAWRLQRHLPRSVYLKIEAHDDAGNTAEVISPEPIAIDVPTASGSLQGVRAAR